MELRLTSKSKKALIYSFITVLIYRILIDLIQPDGFSFFKMALTLFLWISFGFIFSVFIGNFQSIKKNIPIESYIIYLMLIIWNLVSIVRSSLETGVQFTTLFGNTFTSMALLVPFALVFGVDVLNLNVIGKLLLKASLAGAVVFILAFPFSGILGSLSYYNLIFDWLYCSLFLITFFPFQLPRKKLLIILINLLLLFLSIATENRTMVIRLAGMGTALLFYFYFYFSKSKLFLVTALFSLFIPVYIMKMSFDSSQSLIGKVLSYSDDEKLNADTRTFIYLEVFDDLKLSNSLITGKGSCGKYFSPYFSEEPGDSSNRISVEVGLLALLLKGGLIAVLLNLIMLIMAIWLAFFKSNNKVMVGFGILLLIHTQILFIENFVNYSLYNLLIWFIIGTCLSKDIRSLSDAEIVQIMNLKNEGI